MKRLAVLLVAVALLIGCGAPVEGVQEERFRLVHSQGDIVRSGIGGIDVLYDTWTGACWIDVNSYSTNARMSPAPKEVCEAKKP